jgi:hypothetical protein
LLIYYNILSLSCFCLILNLQRCKYHFDKFENRNGFFLGYRPHCVDVFIDEEHQEAIINIFSYFTNCSVGKIFDFPTQEIKPSFSLREKLGFICSISGNFPRKDGTDKNSKSFLSLESKWHRHFDSPKHLMETTIQIIKEKYKNIKVIKLTDNSTINCGIHKFPLYIYMILYYGETYYMKYGFLPENKSRNLEIINTRINEKIVKLENIIEFTKNNLFPEETNKDFIKLCKKIIKKDNKLKYFLEEIKFIKDKGKKSCNYFFSFLEYIYTIFFPGFNFFQESYSISLK